MEKYRFIINDTTLKRNPENWKDIKVSIERQEDIEGLLLIFTSELNFVKDGYDLLKELFDDNYNENITANIDKLDDNGNYERLFTGVILLSDITFNLNEKTARVKLEDISFFGRIDNNKNIKTFLNSGFTKNGEKITETTAYQLDFFIPATGVYKGWGNRDCYLVSDALDFLVRFMTDDVVKGIVSTYLTTASNFEDGYLYVTTGEEIRTGTGEHPNISFKGLFQFLKHTHNISFVMETNTDGDPVMRIEEKEFFFEQATSYAIQDIKDLELRVNRDALFSHLEVGNKTFEKSGNFSTTTRFFSFRDEDYTIEGGANIDKALDLRTEYVSDNNVIEKIVVTNSVSGDDEFDENIIIVTGNTDGTLTNKYGTPDFHYNKGLTNDQIILRHLNSIPLSIAKYLSTESTPSKASKRTPTPFGFHFPQSSATPYTIDIIRPIDFDNDCDAGNYDLGNNYSAGAYCGEDGNYWYEIPFGGVFSFFYRLTLRTGFFANDGSVPLNNITGETMSYHYKTAIERWNSSFTVRQQIIEHSTIIQSLTSVAAFTVYNPLIVSRSVSMNNCVVGDKIVIKIAITLDSFSRPLTSTFIAQIDSGYFKCKGADNDAGVYQYFNPEDYRVLIYNFRKNTNFTDFNTLTDQSLRRIKFNEGSDPTLDKLAWIDKVDYKVETSETDYQLIT